MNNKIIWYLPKGYVAYTVSGKNVLAIINKMILHKHASNDIYTNIRLTETVSVISNDVLTYITTVVIT